MAGNPSRKRVGTERCGVRTVSLPPISGQPAIGNGRKHPPADCPLPTAQRCSRSSMAEPRGATARTRVRFPPAAPFTQVRLGSWSGDSAALKTRRGGLGTYPRHQSRGTRRVRGSPLQGGEARFESEVLHHSPIVQRQDARLLIGQSRFESWSGSQRELGSRQQAVGKSLLTPTAWRPLPMPMPDHSV